MRVTSRYAFLMLLAGIALWRQTHTATTTVVVLPGEEAAPPANSGNVRERWAIDFLALLGNATPDTDTIEMVVEWTLAEDACTASCNDGHIAAFERNNPLNTTQPGFMETLTINGDGVRGYDSWQSGLDASVHTVTNGLYKGVVDALLNNDGIEAKKALWNSPWASSHYGYGASWPSYQLQEVFYGVPSNYQLSSNPISTDASAFGVNVRAALNARGGALRKAIIRPDESWSFNATIGDPTQLVLETVIHPGDGWCNLAARYAQVGRAAGLEARFQDHNAGDLGGGVENSVAIWNVGGLPGTADGRQDLELYNPTDRTVILEAIEEASQVVIVATIS